MSIKIGYAGDRQIAVDILNYILDDGIIPLTLIVSDKDSSTHSNNLISISKGISEDLIFKGSQLYDDQITHKISELNLDYLICIHFPYIIPETILNCVNVGVLNLHPAYLPFNRGWHTATWAILDKTPYGATLHFMDNSLDTGDIIHQKKISINSDDTAHSLYQKVLQLEIDVFTEAWPKIKNKILTRKNQKELLGTTHKKEDIRNIQKIDLSRDIEASYILDLLRALTTNDIHEAAYFEQNGDKYRVQISIKKDSPE